MNYTNLSVGTEVYYTGDMANNSGTGKIVVVHTSDQWTSYPSYDIKLDDGRLLRGIPTALFGTPVDHCGHRFQLVSERQAARLHC